MSHQSQITEYWSGISVWCSHLE